MYLEAHNCPAILEDGAGVPIGWVHIVKGAAVGGLIVDAQALAQQPEVVAVQVQGVLLLSCPVGSHSSTPIVAACLKHWLQKPSGVIVRYFLSHSDACCLTDGH